MTVLRDTTGDAALAIWLDIQTHYASTLTRLYNWAYWSDMPDNNNLYWRTRCASAEGSYMAGYKELDDQVIDELDAEKVELLIASLDTALRGAIRVCFYRYPNTKLTIVARNIGQDPLRFASRLREAVRILTIKLA